jgi:flagellar secretion chaperone FliS
MLPAAKKLASYRTVSVDTASPGKLILMLYDGALRFLRTAEDGFALDCPRQRQETIHNNIMKAEAIVQELQRCLNVRDGGDFAVNMFRLYDFMMQQLIDANIAKDPEKIRTVLRLLGDVRDAWAQMLSEQGTQTDRSASLSMSA